MRSNLSPCKDCKDRWIDVSTGARCHSSCEKYQDYKKDSDKKREEGHQQRKIDRAVYELNMRYYNKNK